jgi:CubicO group peptidase (beta-lactamase class C family)
LAAVVCAVTGKSFEQYLKEWLWEPLGMKDIAFQPTEKSRAHMAAHYNLNSDQTHVVNRGNDCPYILSPRYESGGAGLFSTVTAYSKFLTALANGKADNGYVLLKPETIRMISETDLMTPGGRDGLRAAWPSRFFGYSWGLCGRVHQDPVRSLSLAPKGEFGWDGAACSYCLIDPTNRLSVMLGLNVRGFTYGYYMLHPHIRNLVYTCLDA